MRENPIGNALAFLVATDKLWFTVIFWLLLLGSAAVAALVWRTEPAQRCVHHIGYGLMRVHVVAAVAVEDTAALGLGPDPLDGGDGRTCVHPASKHARARPRLAQYRRLRPPGLRHRGVHSGIADPRRG